MRGAARDRASAWARGVERETVLDEEPKGGARKRDQGVKRKADLVDGVRSECRGAQGASHRAPEWIPYVGMRGAARCGVIRGPGELDGRPCEKENLKRVRVKESRGCMESPIGQGVNGERDIGHICTCRG